MAVDRKTKVREGMGGRKRVEVECGRKREKEKDEARESKREERNGRKVERGVCTVGYAEEKRKIEMRR